MSARTAQPSSFEDIVRRKQSLAEHEELVTLIAVGDAVQAASRCRLHTSVSVDPTSLRLLDSRSSGCGLVRYRDDDIGDRH